MKQVISVSLGSSSRDKKVLINILGEDYEISRIGTDGDMKRFSELLKDNDGKVDAIGLGGIDLYLYMSGKKYTIRDAENLTKFAKITPVVDGSGVKNTIERLTIKYLSENNIIDFYNSKIMLVCSLDRFGVAESLCKLCQEKNVLYGDLMFAIDVNLPLYNYNHLKTVANILLPIACNIPFKYLYPTGDKQKEHKKKYQDKYAWSDIIAGDFHYINKYLPDIKSDIMKDKIIITNTLVDKDIEELKSRGVKLIISSTPSLNGRNFGTNVLEGIIISKIGKSIYETSEQELDNILTEMNWQPSIVYER